MHDRDKVIRLIEEEISVCESVNQCYRTIDLPALRDILALLKEQEAENSKISNAYLELVGKASKQPHIVRCKDCKKHDTYDCSITYLTTQKTPNDWFCADGERRESE